MDIFSTKFKTLLLFSSIALLTACNQSNNTENPPTAVSRNTASLTPTAMSAPQTGRSMDTMVMASSTSTTQPAYIADYRKVMTVMHDKMMSASQIANADVAFATGMIAHHQGAADMAKIQLKYGKDTQMRTLAKNIIKTQQSEIQEMQTWLEKHKNDRTPANATMPTMNMKNNDAMMQGVMNPDPDIAFANGMIPHHQGAIDMADMELKMGKEHAMLTLAKQIKSAQDPEIKQMQAWLATKDIK